MKLFKNTKKIKSEKMKGVKIKSDKVKSENIVVIAIFISITFAVIITILGMSYYKIKINELGLINSTSYTNYEKHYALITENRDQPFWNSVYEGALEEGKRQNIYVENFGSSLPIHYSMNELLEMAISAKVDGIIVEANNEEKTKKQINQAIKEGIPVVTVLEDSIQSDRQCFVGVNNYNLGKEYGNQILDTLDLSKDKTQEKSQDNTANIVKDKSIQKVMVLLDTNSTDTSQNIILTGIKEAIADVNVKLQAVTIDSQNTFSSEEAIRNIIMNTEYVPDTLICLNYVDTMCAYQAVVDYNMVGKINIIGYYNSTDLLTAIKKEIIYSTIVIDTNQMGEYCVKALAEYAKTKHISDYTSVDTNLITIENVNTYLNNQNNEITAITQ